MLSEDEFSFRAFGLKLHRVSRLHAQSPHRELSGIMMQIMMQGHLPAVQEMAMLPGLRRLLVELLLNRDPN